MTLERQKRPLVYLAVVGPTASGKSALALDLAHELSGELINCDSVQLYRGFVIGAAQPPLEEQAAAPHHLWSFAAWNENVDAYAYAGRAEETIAAVKARGRLPILVGGTGLYLRALWRENWHELPKSEELRKELSVLETADVHTRLKALDPQRAAALHANDRFRLLRALEVALLLGHPLHELPPARGLREQAFVIQVQCPRDILHGRIAERTRQMISDGLIEEVSGLLAQGVDPTCKPMQSIGYAQTIAYLQGLLPRERLEEAIVIATRQYARRQETWFRKLDSDFSWRPDSNREELVKKIRDCL